MPALVWMPRATSAARPQHCCAQVRAPGTGIDSVVQGKANFRGHPLHLIFISFPVAFWSGAVFTDISGVLTHDAFWFRMSATLVAMGTIVAALAAIFGFIDYYTVAMSKRARRLALLHMLSSLATLAVFALACALRRTDDASPPGIALTAVGTVLLLIAGYFGSELANRFGIGVVERTTAPRSPAPTERTLNAPPRARTFSGTSPRRRRSRSNRPRSERTNVAASVRHEN